jgi:hypothetical protein
VSPRGAIQTGSALRSAALALLAAWDAPKHEGLEEAVAALRDVIKAHSIRYRRDPSAPRPPRTGTKQESVLVMLHREDGATVAQAMEATGWQRHTIRGFLAELKRKGTPVDILERVRQVGRNKQGAKGSCSVYRVAAAPAEAC